MDNRDSHHMANEYAEKMISVVIPVFNEAEAIVELYNELVDVLSKEGVSYELLFIDDASFDTTKDILRELVQHEEVKAYRLLFNSNKSGALNVGFFESRGDIVITIDGDLQDDPSEIPRLLAEINNGADMVNTWKKNRKDPWHKRLVSRGMNTISAYCFGRSFRDMNTGFKCYQSPIAKLMRLPDGQYRFIPHILAAQGYSVSEIPVSHRPRKYGHTKFGLLHRMKSIVDLCIAWFGFGLGGAWINIIAVVGLLLIVLGASFLFYLFQTWLGSDYPRMRPLLIGGVFLILFGMQILCLVFLARLYSNKRYSSELPVYNQIK